MTTGDVTVLVKDFSETQHFTVFPPFRCDAILWKPWLFRNNLNINFQTNEVVLGQEHISARFDEPSGAASDYWPRMGMDVKRFVHSCGVCQRTKRGQSCSGFLQSLPVPKQLWTEISIDFIMGLPQTPNGYNAIYTFVDRLTKAVHLEIKVAQDAMVAAQARQAFYADQGRAPASLVVGDQVMVFRDFLLTPDARNQPSRKLRPKWFGPFKVIERIGSNAYRLELLIPSAVIRCLTCQPSGITSKTPFQDVGGHRHRQWLIWMDILDMLWTKCWTIKPGTIDCSTWSNGQDMLMPPGSQPTTWWMSQARKLYNLGSTNYWGSAWTVLDARFFFALG